MAGETVRRHVDAALTALTLGWEEQSFLDARWIVALLRRAPSRSRRRLALSVGASAEVTAAWYDYRTQKLERLRQIYRRVSTGEYVYSSPDHGFTSTLRVDEHGFVRRYPPLWEEA